jgi:uncharacterized protein
VSALEQWVRGVYASLERGDLDAVAAMIADDAVYVNPDDALEQGTRRGRDEVMQAVGGLVEALRYSVLEIEDLVESGDRVLVVVRARSEDRGSGVALDARGGHLYDFREGKIVRFEWSWDPDELRRSAFSAG